MSQRAARFLQVVRPRARRQDGATLVVTAASLVVVLGFAALAIDLGAMYQEQRQAQSAADAAALAGARYLPTGPGTATTDADARDD